MDPIKANSAAVYATTAAKTRTPLEKSESANLLNSVTKVEQNKVTLSDEGKALLAELQKVERADAHKQSDDTKEKSVGDKVESFTYGALGMEHPEKIKEEKDGSYSAGQYFSGAATLGAILLALV